MKLQEFTWKLHTPPFPRPWQEKVFLVMWESHFFFPNTLDAWSKS